jgi:hypothetical protein
MTKWTICGAGLALLMGGASQLSAQVPAAPAAPAAAAKIKASEAGANDPAAAVEYLGRADCSHWPEAGDVLLYSLRADKNESVRFAAAQALGTGCYCGKKTIDALSIAAMGSNRDGNPAEKSERVRLAALASLEKCLTRCGYAIPVPTAAPKEGSGEAPAPIKPVSATEVAGCKPVEPAAGSKRVEEMNNAQVSETVRRTNLTWKDSAAQTTATGEINPGMATSSPYAADHSLLGAVASAFATAKSAFAFPGRQPQPARSEMMKVTEPARQSPYQSNAIQTVGYRIPRADESQARLETSPAPAPYRLPVAKPAQKSALPQLSASASYYPPANGLDVGYVLKLLRDGKPAEQRVWAAAELSSVDGRGNPDVVDALVAIGQIDLAASVRRECVRSLVKMNASGPAVHELFESLQKDSDPSVQQEARRALGKTKY